MMKLKEVRWGFIGCGEVTEKKSGPAFNMIEGSNHLHRYPSLFTRNFCHYGHESRETGLYRKTDGRQLRGLCPH